MIAVAWFAFAALSAPCQSSPAAQVADCPTADHQATATGGEANDSIAAVRPEIQSVGRSSFAELVHIALRVRAFRSQSDYFRTRFRYTVKFERGADLEAIRRGYGDGLKAYRTWVYNHIPPDRLQQKLRTYFSPEEIAAIQMKLQDQPDRFEYRKRHVPMNLQEIQRTR